MKKIITASLLSVFLFIFSFGVVQAAPTPSVTFDGSSTLKYSGNVNNFGAAFNAMQPSETRTLNILLRNTSDKNVDFYMSTEILESLESQMSIDGSAGYRVSMTLKNGNTQTYIFGSEDGALIGANENGLYDLNGTLSERFLLTALDANSEATLSLTIGIDGSSAQNPYQRSAGTLQFDFSVSYEETVLTNIITNVTDLVRNRVVTGDPTAIAGLFAILAGAGAIVVVSTKRLKGGKQ